VMPLYETAMSLYETSSVVSVAVLKWSISNSSV
jgi:hypothetical protein